MRNSAVEGPHAPRARQTPPTGTGGGTASLVSSPRPQLTAGALVQKLPIHAISRASSVSSSPQNRASSQQRSSSVQAQVARQKNSSASGQDHLQSQQQRPSANTTATSNSNAKAFSSHKAGQQPRQSSQQHQTPASVKSLQQQTVSSKSSNSGLVTAGTKGQQGTGPPNSKSSSQSANPPSFGEYDDQEWDVGVGHLIIDLDADIAQADRGKMNNNTSPAPANNNSTQSLSAAEDKHSLKMKIKRTKPPTKTSEAKHEIVKPDIGPATGLNNSNSNSPAGNQTTTNPTQLNGVSNKEENGSSSIPRGPSSTARVVYKKDKRRTDVNGVSSTPNVIPVPQSRPPSQNPSTTATTTTQSSSVANSQSNQHQANPTPHGIHSSLPVNTTTSSQLVSPKSETVSVIASPAHVNVNQDTKLVKGNGNGNLPIQISLRPKNSETESSCSEDGPPLKRLKVSDETCVKKDMCVGTSVGTVTEPDCLGPCEPGSSVTLEGIVWHETEGGVLVVNVTWRGKTYVGTLLDCTKHDWAPPRFCDSPTSDLETRTPKGRAKRGRGNASAASTPTTSMASSPATSNSNSFPGSTDLALSETRSGKVRQPSIKGRGRGGVAAAVSASPVKDSPGVKRKGKDADLPSPAVDNKAQKKARSMSRGTPTNDAPSPSPDNQQSQCDNINNNSNNNNNDSTALSSSPPLIECPEPNCNKKYKHANGLKYHQTHAHTNQTANCEAGASDAVNANPTSDVLEVDRQTSPKPLVSTPVDSSQEILKPAVLRPSVPVSSVNENISSIKEHNSSQEKSKGYSVSTSGQPGNKLNCDSTDANGANSTVMVESGENFSSQNKHIVKENSNINNLQNSTSISDGSSHLTGTPNAVTSNNQQNIPDQSIGYHQTSQQSIIQKSTQVSAIIQPNNAPHLSPSQAMQQNSSSHKVISNLQSSAPISNQSHIPHHLQQSSNQALQRPPVPFSHSHRAPVPITQVHGSHIKSYSQVVQMPPRSQGAPPHLPTPPFQNQNQNSQPIILSSIRSDVKQDLITRMNNALPISSLAPSNCASSSIPESSSALPASSQHMSLSTIPQGTPLSSLPGSTGTNIVKSGEEMDSSAGKSKELLVNGLPPSKPESELVSSREDARSPAYSDISDANESAPVIEDDDKDRKDDKKGDLGVGVAPPYAYGLYYGAYGQPTHPYLMHSPGHGPPILPHKTLDMKDFKDKMLDKDKDFPPIPGGNEFMKMPGHYMYPYPQMYPPGYPDIYVGDPLSKDLDKSKLDQNENPGEIAPNKGPTDLSKNSEKERKIDTLPTRDNPDNRGLIISDRRTLDPYRYSSHFDSRIPLAGSLQEKSIEVKIPGVKPSSPALSSPRLSATSPGVNNGIKDEKFEKRPEGKVDGVKPTMETTGPPLPPTSAAFYPHFPYGPVGFDHYRPGMIPGMPITPGLPPYISPGPPGLPGLRYPLGVPNCPEDLSSNGGSGSHNLPSSLFPGSHKIAELQERAQKSPSATSPAMSISGPAPPPLYSLTHSTSPPPAISGLPHQSMPANSQISDRKSPPPPIGMRFPPHPSLPEGYAYPFLSSHFSPHFSALGMNPAALPTVGLAGTGASQPGIAAGAHPPK